MGNTQTVYLPPWVPATDEEHANADAYTEAVRAISAVRLLAPPLVAPATRLPTSPRLHPGSHLTVPRNFIEPDAVVHSADFSFDWTTHRAFAEAAYRGDVRLGKLLPRLVPKHVTEEEFWRNYFSRVYAVKQRFSPGGAPDAPTDAPAPPAAEPPVVPAEEPAEEEPAQRQKDSAGISDATSAATQLVRAASLTSQLPYPERFELAVKFVKEGPSLPEDAAPGDRILMDVLSQQAIIGQCNVPRPGMWDTAEAKARHDAWVKLGSMSKHEAMHLCALEIFCKEWVLWEGLHITPEMAKRADAVTTMTPTRPSTNAREA
ncbi:hypothetical protein T492DRAFT_841658 [Pavlovales sp. CCMP2436]|nr:hypothetical protein T492DRAFT_841658 [Pavlovales sp. CCMP2436]